MKRTERKHLKENEFAQGLQRFFHFLGVYKMWIAGAAAVAAAGLLVFLGVKFFQAKALERKGKTETEILEVYAGLDKNPEAVARLETWADKGRSGRLAGLLLAGHWVERGELEKAEAVLSKIPDSPRDFLFYQSRDLMGQVYFQRKNYDKAIEVYTAIQSGAPEGYVLDVVLFRLAEALEKKGQKSEALELYKKVRDEHIEGAFSYQAAQKVRELE